MSVLRAAIRFAFCLLLVSCSSGVLAAATNNPIAGGPGDAALQARAPIHMSFEGGPIAPAPAAKGCPRAPTRNEAIAGGGIVALIGLAIFIAKASGGGGTTPPSPSPEVIFCRPGLDCWTRSATIREYPQTRATCGEHIQWLTQNKFDGDAIKAAEQIAQTEFKEWQGCQPASLQMQVARNVMPRTLPFYKGFDDGGNKVVLFNNSWGRGAFSY